nr:amino acid ABC transporter permease [Natronobeatus ordinarius]
MIGLTSTALPLETIEPVAAVAAEDWEFVLRNREYLLYGALITVALTATSIVLGFALGFPAGAIERYGGRYSSAFVRKAGVVIRGTPILVIMVFTFFVFPLEWLFVLPVSEPFQAAILALGVRSAAYQSQIFRGALQSIDPGQFEAAQSIGLSKWKAIRYVLVPQALRRSVPGFQNEFTIVLKDTSIAFAIGLGELLRRSHDLMTQQTTAALELFLFASLIYFVLTVSTNRTLDFVNDRYAIPGEG